MKSLLDKSFRYTPAVDTDVRKTFTRERRRLKAAAQADQRNEQERVEKVSELPRKKVI